MGVPIKEDSQEKADLRGKKHSVHVTTFITSFMYIYVHGDLSSTRLFNKSEMYLSCKLDCEDTNPEKV